MPVKQAPPQTTLPKKASPGSPRKGSGLTPASKSSPAGLPPPPSTPGVDRTVRLLAQFQRFARDFWGVICLALAVMTFFQLFAPKMPGGVLLSWWVSQLRHFLGWGAIWIVLGLGYLGLRLLQRKDTVWPRHIPLLQILLLEIGMFATIALLAVFGGSDLLAADRGEDGGIVGWGLAELLRIFMAPFGLGGSLWRALLLILIAMPCLFIGLGIAQRLYNWASQASGAPVVNPEELNGGPMISEAPLAGKAVSEEAAKASKKRTLLPPEFRKKLTVPTPADERPLDPVMRDERLPPVELLVHEQASRPDERNINLTAGLIEKTLAEFGIPATVVGFRVGPTVTQFAVEPGFVEKAQNGDGEARQKVRVAQIAGLSRDLALALSAERLRIEAPVPGRPYVGIEVPNSRSSFVRLRQLLESEAMAKVNSPLAIALGRDVSGAPVVGDLGTMPHLLIAGTTGSGKSVCIAAITACLVMNNTPEDLRLVMVDPKMVELVRFNGLPHLFGKVETNLERILGVLRWTVAEMDRRYKLLEASHSRNLETYNRKARRRKGEEPLPRIVLMIDELADLMMSAPDQTEHNLVRLAQMARATGIHLVVATQRPSTDVVTGLIKANFPARISFAVASGVDSRVILDTQGAESLLGRGDMLFLAPESSSPIRAQGVWVIDQEIERIISFWQKSIPALEETEIPPWDEMLQQESMLADRDDLLDQAIAVIKKTRRASASLLQRRLHIGYPRAARLIDELAEMGYIGPSQPGGRDRDVLISDDEPDLLGGDED